MESGVRTIKRYANRKLYDTHQSVYITLEEMAQIIREGQEVVTIDNKTKEDITYRTFIQLLHELEKKNSAQGGDVKFLSRVIRSEDGTFSGYAQSLERELGLADETPVASSVDELSSSASSELSASEQNVASSLEQ